jgi:hypothetical protein
MPSSNRIHPTCLVLIAFYTLVFFGCSRQPVAVIPEEPITGLAFDLFWPPRDLKRLPNDPGEPLLNGELSIVIQSHQNGNKPNAFGLNVTLTRGSSDLDRERWNKDLAFPEHAWMSRVRVWDSEGKWIWPNLPYLLRAHGEPRIERYGGVDPTKGVDNDFAAVLIRPLDDESSRPLVSAEWYADNAVSNSTIETSKHSVVHVASSDDFIVRVPNGSSSGTIGVWLIYADIIEANMPRTWPSEGEYNGGILAYFEIQWSRAREDSLEYYARQLTPKSATGFDWEQWSTAASPLEKNLRSD